MESPHYCSERLIGAYSRRHGLALRTGLRRLMETGIFPEHFRRNAGLIAPQDQLRLLDLPVFIAGCGGLGGEMAAQLARLGAGKLYLCDYDSFEESNLNRQRFCSLPSIGKPKAETAAAALAEIAPWGEYRPVRARLTPDSPPPFPPDCAIVIDCLDSVSGKKMLEEMAQKAGLAWLHGAVLQHEGFACLKASPGGTLEALYGPDTRESGAGSVLAHVVAGTASLMLALFTRWLANAAYTSRLVHADYSVPEVESLELP